MIVHSTSPTFRSSVLILSNLKALGGDPALQVSENDPGTFLIDRVLKPAWKLPKDQYQW